MNHLYPTYTSSQVSNGSTIDYYYAADGTKLQEIRTVSGTATKIDWCGDLVIEKVGSGTRAEV